MTSFSDFAADTLLVQRIIAIKNRDKAVQLIVCVLSLVLVPFTMAFSLYLMGLTHAIGTFYWKFAFRGIHRISGRYIIEVINIMVILLLLAAGFTSYYWGTDLFWMASVAMLAIGPVLGVAYYIVTIKEIRFYKNLLVNERA